MEGVERIPINIWDDYHEEGHIPEGEKQETYIYVEYNFPKEKQKEYLELLLTRLIPMLDGVKLYMFFYDSKIKYPNISPEEHPYFHFERWEIRAENLTHPRREKLVDELNELALSADEMEFEVYSES